MVNGEVKIIMWQMDTVGVALTERLYGGRFFGIGSVGT